MKNNCLNSFENPSDFTNNIGQLFFETSGITLDVTRYTLVNKNWI